METDLHPKIAVIGAGAVGSLVGGLLARAGEDVTLVGRKAHVEAVRQNGLLIEGILGQLTVPVKAAEALDFRPDLVLLAVKTQDSEAACRGIFGLAGDATVLTLQNGVRSDSIVASVFPPEKVLSGVVMLNAQYLEPGRITYARAGALLVGEIGRLQAIPGPGGTNASVRVAGGKTRRAEEIRNLLGRAVRTEVSANIRGAHWAKLLVNNLGNGMEAMSGLAIHDCMSHPGLRRIGVLSMKEGYSTIRKSGFRLADLPGLPASVLAAIVGAPVPAAAWILGKAMGSSPTLSSTLQSLKRGRPTEIEYLNGEIVRLGEAAGLPTPYNAAIVDLVREAGRTGHFLPVEELLRRFEFSK